MQPRQFTPAHIICAPARFHRRIAILSASLAFLSSAGCGSSKSTAPADAGTMTDGGSRRRDAGEIGEDAGTIRAACADPLKIDPANAFVLPLDLLTLVPSGGTRGYQFEIARNRSGAIINPLSGAYLSGEIGGVHDVVVLTDTGCDGTATATVNVVKHMIVEPMDVELSAGGRFRYRMREGSGQFRLALLPGGTAGGTLDASGLYMAGATEGRDRVRVTDIATREEVEAQISVVRNAVLRPDPPMLFFPVGSRYKLKVLGGSGTFDVVSTSTAISYSAGTLESTGAARADLAVTDTYTGQTTRIMATSIAPSTFTSTRSGKVSMAATVIGPGDIDGDGFPDALVAWPESDINGVNSGAVFLYRGRQGGGLERNPSRIFAGVSRNDDFGRSIVAADFDGDGLTDLAIGASRASVGASSNGAVYIYKGIRGGFFSPDPIKVLAGRFGGEQFGYAMTTCDFNHDGRIDLAVSSPGGQDRDRRMQSSRQGEAFVFLGYPDGFLDRPDSTVFGDVPDEQGVYGGVANLQLGTALAAGDVDGDGACDLIVAASNFKVMPSFAADGLIFVYRGISAGAQTLGGISTQPVWAVTNLDANDQGSSLARSMSAGDLDGDGKAEIVLSQHLHSKALPPPNPPRQQGAVRIFRGRALPMTPTRTLLGADSADWLYEGRNGSDQAGWFVSVEDVDGDHRPDLLVGNVRGDVPPANGHNGSVAIFNGRGNRLPDPTPSREISGGQSGDQLGLSVAALQTPAVDLITFAGASNLYGRNVGAPYFMPTAPAMPPVPLYLPGPASASQVGRGFDVVGDVTGDGIPDLVVGAPQAGLRTIGLRTGVAWLYRGTATGFERSPALELAAFTGNHSYNLFGWQVSRAGDFDGDGIPDFAVVARTDSRPATFPAASYTQTSCPGGARSSDGAVYIFRGSRNGLPSPTPAFVYYGPQAGTYLWTVTGGVDIDGDGKGDVIVGGPEWNRTGRNTVGGFAVLRGRPATPGKITVICEADFTFFGVTAGGQVGRGIAALGDINGDGCGDFAVGAPIESLGVNTQGIVRVFLGWGGMRCPAVPRVIALGSAIAGAQAGYAVAGGLDVDGDQIPDLAVGGVGTVVGGNSVGSAWIVPGAYLRTLPSEAFVDDMPPASIKPLIDPARAGNFRVDGTTAGERFGSAIALVPNASGRNRAGLLSGGPFSAYSGTGFAGVARVFRFDLPMMNVSGGLNPISTAAMGGETPRTGGRMGEWVAAGAGAGGNGSLIVVGGYESSGMGIDQGAVYALPLIP